MQATPSQIPFTLELYYEADGDRPLAEAAAARHRKLVSLLAPHIALRIDVRKASVIVRFPAPWGATRTFPSHEPSAAGAQALLITAEDIGAEGIAGPPQGCVSRRAIEGKLAKGADPADLTVHEWLHTIAGTLINGRPVPNPDHHSRFGFPLPSGRGPDGADTWHEWYRYALRQ